MWAAADHKFAFSITREFNVREDNTFVIQAPFFVAHASRLDGSKRWRIGWKFETFEEAVRLCSVYTRTSRRQVGYHEVCGSSIVDPVTRHVGCRQGGIEPSCRRSDPLVGLRDAAARRVAGGAGSLM
jgi:hypothetical protein